MTSSPFSCPLPPVELMAHDSGRRLSRQLIATVFHEAFRKSELLRNHDGAELVMPPGCVVLTPDSYVVRPLFFPGGDIATLAICGAWPLYFSAAFILKEGLPIDILRRVARAMRFGGRRRGRPHRDRRYQGGRTRARRRDLPQHHGCSGRCLQDGTSAQARSSKATRS